VCGRSPGASSGYTALGARRSGDAAVATCFHVLVRHNPLLANVVTRASLLATSLLARSSVTVRHRHRIDKYLDTLLANQPISDGAPVL